MRVDTCYCSTSWGCACSGLALSVGAAAPLPGASGWDVCASRWCGGCRVRPGRTGYRALHAVRLPPPASWHLYPFLAWPRCTIRVRTLCMPPGGRVLRPARTGAPPFGGGAPAKRNGGSRCADTGRAEWPVSRILPPQHETDHHYICALARRPLGFPPPTEGWWGDR